MWKQIQFVWMNRFSPQIFLWQMTRYEEGGPWEHFFLFIFYDKMRSISSCCWILRSCSYPMGQIQWHRVQMLRSRLPPIRSKRRSAKRQPWTSPWQSEPGPQMICRLDDRCSKSSKSRTIKGDLQMDCNLGVHLYKKIKEEKVSRPMQKQTSWKRKPPNWRQVLGSLWRLATLEEVLAF